MTPPLAPELVELRRRITAESLDLRQAASRIGVGVDVLTRHLAGNYVRSDSLAKYRRWLGKGSRGPAKQLKLLEPLVAAGEGSRSSALAQLSLVDSHRAPQRPHIVVDLFSGCGGMSLGFDLLRDGTVFETLLALDVEEPMVRAFNANHPGAQRGAVAVCRRVDLSDLLNESEVLGFYLDHLAALRSDGGLRKQLDALPELGLSAFVAAVGEIDRRFIDELRQMRDTAEYRAALKRFPQSCLGQTSIIGFHAALGLPMPSSANVEVPPLIWADRATGKGSAEALDRLDTTLRTRSRDQRSQLQRRWSDEITGLRARSEGSGRGQLGSSAAKVRSFLPFLDEPVFRKIQSLWLAWQSDRQALRAWMFEDSDRYKALRALYDRDDRRVSVVLGGPPCQGFSRIGRGKIRSLRDQQVHVQVDSGAGDTRNRLLHKYVLFVSALAPSVFLFENVRHFQAEVRTPDGTFLASEILAEAIREVSTAGLRYSVANRIIDASQHLVPETRERFFMVGIRSEVSRDAGGKVGDLPAWCLALRSHAPIPVRVVLDGLPPPMAVSDARANGAGLDQEVTIAPGDRSGRGASQLLAWLQQDPPADSPIARGRVDAHHVRSPRPDDAALFGLFGPGKRWMDYRCDESETLRDLRSLISTLRAAVQATGKESPNRSEVHRVLAGVDAERLKEIELAVDGSLSLRLLMEAIPPLPGELRHHFITSGYLSKREGNHGDWMARLHADRPSKTIVSHMAKDTYAFVHPSESRTLSVREAARIQTFPDWFRFGMLGLVEGFRVIGNAVPPLLSNQLAERVAEVLQAAAGVRRIEPSLAVAETR